MAADIEGLLATRYSDLTRSRFQSDVVSEMCRILLEPWPNRDSSGVRMTAVRMTDDVKGSEAGGTGEGGRMGEVPLESGSEGAVPQNRASIGEPPQMPCSSPEVSIDMEGLEEILAKARKVRETQSKLSGEQSKSKHDLVTSVKVQKSKESKIVRHVNITVSVMAHGKTDFDSNETSKTAVKKKMQKAIQVYTKQSGRPKPRSATLHSASGSSLNQAQTSKKTSGSVDLKAKSSCSQLHSVSKTSERLSGHARQKQGRTQGAGSVGGEGVRGGVKGKEKGRVRKPEWCSVALDSPARSEEEEEEDGGVESLVSRISGAEDKQRPISKELGPFAKEDKMKGYFRLSESGKNIDMPLKYHRLKKAAVRVTAELNAQQSPPPSSYGDAFVTKLNQLDDMAGLCTADVDRYIQLLLFREECRTVQSQILQYRPQKVTEQRLSQQKQLSFSDPESLKLRFVELEKSWGELSRGECTSSTDQWSLIKGSRDEVNARHCQQPKQSFYTNVKEWLEYSQLQHEVAQLEWEVRFLKACLTVILPKLKQSTNDRSHLHTLQSVYCLCGITQPSFVIMPGSNT